MNDDELSERLARTLHAKAEQVQEHDFAPDSSLALAALDATPVTPVHGWRFATVAVVVVLLGVGVGAGITIRNRVQAPDSPRARVTTSTAPRSRLAVEGWSDVPDAAPDGSVSVDHFNALLDAHNPSWQRSAADVAVVFSHLAYDRTAENGRLTTTETIESSARARVRVTLTGIADASTASERYDVDLRLGAHGWRAVSAQWTQQCQQNRGHQNFSTEECL